METFRKECLDAHNRYRKKHGVGVLVLDSEITAESQRWAEHCASSDTWRYSNATTSNTYGENMYAQYASVTRDHLNGATPVDEFYKEAQHYQYGSMEYTCQTGRFTQMIWKGTTRIGVGRAEASSGNIYVVVNYSPVGNYAGQFRANVLPLASQPQESSEKQQSVAGGSKPGKPVEWKVKQSPAVSNNSKFDAFSLENLDVHNEYRRKHGAPPLVLDESLTRMAQNWANTNAAQCRMYHSQNRPSNIGENIFSSWGSAVRGRQSVDWFYSEIKYYRFGGMGFTSQTGHFTQVVWKSTTKMGVGRATGSNGHTYVVVNYSPAGNFHGQFTANVLPPQY